MGLFASQTIGTTDDHFGRVMSTDKLMQLTRFSGSFTFSEWPFNHQRRYKAAKTMINYQEMLPSVPLNSLVNIKPSVFKRFS